MPSNDSGVTASLAHGISSSGTANSNIWLDNTTVNPWQPAISTPYISGGFYTNGTIDLKNQEILTLLEMYFEGKTLEENKQEFIDVIMKMPFVNGNNIKAIQVFNKLKKIFTLLAD